MSTANTTKRSDRPIRRRIKTVPALLLTTLLYLGLSPALALVALLLGAMRRRGFVALRLLLALGLYLAMQVIGLLRAFITGLRTPRGSAEWRDRHVALQAWWGGTLFAGLQKIFNLRLDVQGADALQGPAAMFLPRHVSLIDSLLPTVLISHQHGTPLRFVLKKELLFDPCLDIVGNRLANHFVDRKSAGETERAALRTLASEMKADEGLVLFPEGTRFRPSKRDRILEKLRVQKDPNLARAAALRYTLPPKLGGVSLFREGAPQADMVFIAHSGLEGLTSFRHLWSGAALGQTISARCWRVSSQDLPSGKAALLDFLYQEWGKMDDWVGETISLPKRVPSDALLRTI